MSTLDSFIAEVQSNPEYAAALGANPKLAIDLAFVQTFFGFLKTRADQRTIDLYNKVASIVGRKDVSVKQRFILLQEPLNEVLPWIKARCA